MDKRNQYLNEATLNALRDIMGNEFEPLIHAFIRDADNRLEHLEQAFQSQEAEKLRRSAHMFKGSCLNVGAKQLGKTCKHIEDLAREGRVQDAEPMISSLVGDLQGTKKALIAYLKSMD